MSTGLTESEKESLLKFFLCQGGLTQNSNDQYIWKFYEDYTFLPFEKGLVKIINKAMLNLQLNAIKDIIKLERIAIAGNDAICEFIDEEPLMEENLELRQKELNSETANKK